MGYKLFIDDERIASLKEDETVLIARNYDEAVELMSTLGCPDFISFDHDLGTVDKTGHDIAKWMVEQDLNEDGNFFIDEFTYEVHSQNPIGEKNIRGVLDSYIEFIRAS